MSILTVHISGPAKEDAKQEDRTLQLLFDEAKESPEAFWQHAKLLGKELVAGDAKLRLMYVDEDGDSCTLCKETVLDALSFSQPDADGGFQLRLAAVDFTRVSRVRSQRDVLCDDILRLPLPELAQQMRMLVGNLGFVELFTLLDPLAALSEPQLRPRPGDAALLVQCQALASALGDVPEAIRMKLEAEANRSQDKAVASLPVFLEQLLALRSIEPGAGDGGKMPQVEAAKEESVPEGATQEDPHESTSCSAIQPQGTSAANDSDIIAAGEPAAQTLEEDSCCQDNPSVAALLAEIGSLRSQLAHAQDEAAKAADRAMQAARSEAAAIVQAAALRAALRAEKAKASMASIVPPAAKPSQASAAVVGATSLVLGVEAEEETSARGLCGPAEFAGQLAKCGARQAYRLGHIRITAGGNEPATPVCAGATVTNDGPVPWPATAALALLEGDAFGLPLLPVDGVQPGEAAHIEMDLTLPVKHNASSEQSLWALVDAKTGEALGPMLVLEVTWASPL